MAEGRSFQLIRGGRYGKVARDSREKHLKTLAATSPNPLLNTRTLVRHRCEKGHSFVSPVVAERCPKTACGATAEVLSVDRENAPRV